MVPLGVHGSGRSGSSGSTGSSTHNSRSTFRPTWCHPVTSLSRCGGSAIASRWRGPSGVSTVVLDVAGSRMIQCAAHVAFRYGAQLLFV